MNRAWCFLTALALTLSLSACNAGQTEESSLPEESAGSPAASEIAQPEEPESSGEESETETEGPCRIHTFSYHTITGELINFVGPEEFDAWLAERPGEEMNISNLIADFQIPQEDFSRMIRESAGSLSPEEQEAHWEEFGFTQEQIDALYSGDQKAVNQVFCGPLAFYNEADGELYSIDWLAEHTAEDYLAADLPLEKAEEVIRAAEQETGTEMPELAQKARAALEDARLQDGSAQETSAGGQDTCTAHTPSYHSIRGELMNYVGQEGAAAWAESVVRSGPDGRENMNILAFIEEYDIPKEKFVELTQGAVTDDFLETLGMTREEYYAEFGYTDAQIDALYSGDQRALNEAFCGKLALFNQSDGALYSIDWLAEHTAEDYLAAGFPLEEADAILERAALPENGMRTGQIEAIAPVLEEARALEEE